MKECDSDSSDEEGVTTVYFKEDCNEIVIDDGNENPDEQLSYLCNLCSFEFSSTEELYKHLETDLHKRRKANSEAKRSLEMSNDEVYEKYAREEERKWMQENLNPELGFGFPLMEPPEKNASAISSVRSTKSKLGKKTDDRYGMRYSEVDYRCDRDDTAMARLRLKMHHPLEVFSREFGVPSDEEELEHEPAATLRSGGKLWESSGRRVVVEELAAVASEDQVARASDERVSRLPGGWCLFERKTGGQVTQRVVLVTAYRDMGVGGCCPQPRKV